jgi:chloramphenicol 3-O phosphotransferase
MLSNDLHPDLTEPGKGQIIILNGTSSSGKSSIAIELQAILDHPYHHFAIDRFRSMGAGKTMSDDEFAVYFQRTILGFHRAVAGFASVGNNVIVDYVLGERWRFADCKQVFAGYDLVLVGVHCPLEELERREHERGNRGTGRAASQFPTVHADMSYDVEVDTGTASPRECAETIKNHLVDHEVRRATRRRTCN